MRYGAVRRPGVPLAGAGRDRGGGLNSVGCTRNSSGDLPFGAPARSGRPASPQRPRPHPLAGWTCCESCRAPPAIHTPLHHPSPPRGISSASPPQWPPRPVCLPPLPSPRLTAPDACLSLIALPASNRAAVCCAREVCPSAPFTPRRPLPLSLQYCM